MLNLEEAGSKFLMKFIRQLLRSSIFKAVVSTQIKYLYIGKNKIDIVYYTCSSTFIQIH